MTLKTVDRRTTRNTGRTYSVGDYWELTEPVLRKGHAIRRHGPLPTQYLFPFSGRQSYQMHQKWLTRLHHEPPQFLQTYGVKGFSANCYDVTDYAEEVLQDNGHYEDYIPIRRDPPRHRMHNACNSASFELGTERAGLGYLSLSDIICHPKCPVATRALPNVLEIPLIGLPNKYLSPDQLFAIRYPDQRLRFYFIETDCGTESHKHRTQKKKCDTIYDKYRGYINILEKEKTVSHFGFPRFSILIITTSGPRVKRMMKDIEALSPKYAPNFMFKVKPDMAKAWAVPQNIMYDLVDEPWLSTKGPVYITKA